MNLLINQNLKKTTKIPSNLRHDHSRMCSLTRCHGPWAWVVWTSTRVQGPWTRVVRSWL